jgi:hydrogenase/urease accessory protein HupE
MNSRLSAAVAFVSAILLLPWSARAHQVGLSRGTYHVDGGLVVAEIAFAGADASALRDVDLDVSRALVSGLRVSSSGACAGRALTGPAAGEDRVVAHLAFDCPDSGARIRIEFGMFVALPAGHRHLATLSSGDRSETAVLSSARPWLEIAGASPSSARAPMREIFLFGVSHVLGGADHLLFLLGLVVVARRLRDVATVVTSFTVAHSASLALAATGVWVPDPAWVEPVIALSIAWVGVENLLRRGAPARWPLTTAFGFVHGFGFAGALSEVTPAGEGLWAALASFNLGVEAGQLGVIAIAMPLLAWARRFDAFARHGAAALSAAVIIPGLVWFVLRV